MNKNAELEKNIILVIDDEIGVLNDPERTAFLRAVGYYPSEGGKKRVESFPYEFEFHTGQNESGTYSIAAVKAAVLKRWPTYDGKRWALILLDVRFGDHERFGFEILRALREDPRFGLDLPIVMLTSEGDGKKDEADRLRADGFFPKADELGNPLWSKDGLIQRILSCGLITDDRDDTLIERTGNVRLLGRSLPHLLTLREARRYGLDQTECILYGDSGCGKTELAGYIHCYTVRKGPYIHWFANKSNVDSMKTKLFGKWKTAYTGAERSEPGVIESAHGGTFFLDEVSNLTEEVQTTLLSVRKKNEEGLRGLEREGIFPPSNGRKEAMDSIVKGAIPSGFRIMVDVYLLTGTKDNLEDPNKRQRLGFRDDLHNALGEPFYCPNLNERIEDIPVLFEAFVRRLVRSSEFIIDPDVIEVLCARDWSKRGHLRDLERIARYCARKLGDFRVIRVDRLPSYVLKDLTSPIKGIEVLANEKEKTVDRGLSEPEVITALPATRDLPPPSGVLKESSSSINDSEILTDEEVKTFDQIPSEAEVISALPVSGDIPSSLSGELARADISHILHRAKLIEEAAELTRKVDATTGERTKYQPKLLMSRLMGNEVTGTNAQRFIKEILQPLFSTKVYMLEAYGEENVRAIREWAESRPILMKLYEYAIDKISADKIAE